jgi:hypothetical protein
VRLWGITRCRTNPTLSFDAIRKASRNVGTSASSYRANFAIYRQADRREGAPLTDEERRWFRQIIQRVAALLALGPSLDSLYQEAAANSFSASELDISR